MARVLLTDEEKKRRRSVYYKKYYAKNREHIRAEQKEYCAENHEEIRENQNESYWDAKGPNARELYDKDKERRRKEREAKAMLPKRIPKTKEEIKQRDNERSKKYYAENKDEINRKAKIYYEEHKEELRDKAKKYKDEHGEEMRSKAKLWRNTPRGKFMCRESRRRKRARLLGAEIFPMPDDYEEILFKNQDGLCYYCGELLNRDTMHMDHMNPYSKGGAHSFDNVALTCPDCNLRKGVMTAEQYIEDRK